MDENELTGAGEDPTPPDAAGRPVSPGRAARSKPREHSPGDPQPLSHKKSLVIVYTGDGKGKTTAALGILMRARGRGLRVLMLSFMKAPRGDYGEHPSAEKLGAEIAAVGRGFTWLSDDIEKDKEMARFGWRRARQEIASGMPRRRHSRRAHLPARLRLALPRRSPRRPPKPA